MKRLLAALLLLVLSTPVLGGGKALMLIQDRPTATVGKYSRGYAAITGALIEKYGGTYEILYASENDDSITARISRLDEDGFDLLIGFARSSSELYPGTATSYNNMKALFDPAYYTSEAICKVPTLLCGLQLNRNNSATLYLRNGADTDWVDAWSCLVEAADWDSMRVYNTAGDSIYNAFCYGMKMSRRLADSTYCPAGTRFVWDVLSEQHDAGGDPVLFMWHWDGDKDNSGNDSTIYYINDCEYIIPGYQGAAMLSVLRKFGVIDPIPVYTVMHDFGFSLNGILYDDTEGDTLWANTDTMLQWFCDNEIYFDCFVGFVSEEAEQIRELGHMPCVMWDYVGNEYINFMWGEDEIYTAPDMSTRALIYYLWGDDAWETTDSLYALHVWNRALMRDSYYTDWVDTTWYTFARHNYVGKYPDTYQPDSIMTVLAAMGVRNFMIQTVERNGYIIEANNSYHTIFSPMTMTLPMDMIAGREGDTVTVNIWPMQERGVTDNWAVGTYKEYGSPYNAPFEIAHTAAFSYYFRYLAGGLIHSMRFEDGETTSITWANDKIHKEWDPDFKGMFMYGHHYACACAAPNAYRGTNSYLESVRFLWEHLNFWNGIAGATVFESKSYKSLTRESHAN